MSEKFSKIYDLSIKDPEKFWQEAANDIFWFKKPTKVLNKTNPPFYKWYEDGEEDMLDMAFEPKTNSRLSCQIVVSDEIDGLEVNIPSKQA